MKLKDKVAIVTGGATGIGKAIGLALAAEGAAVALAARNLARLEEAAAEIKAKGGRALAIETDISNEKSVKKMADEVISQFGRIDILVNNAAAFPPNADVANLQLNDWRDVIEVNLTGTMLCCREVLKDMIPRRRGAIVNISSVGGISGQPQQSPYSASKWGIRGLTETLAIEVGKDNIRVNSLSPGATRTEGFEGWVKSLSQEAGIPLQETISRIAENNSLNRIAEPAEIAACAVFLASDDSSAVTGHNLVASCGFHLTQPSTIRWT